MTQDEIAAIAEAVAERLRQAPPVPLERQVWDKQKAAKHFGCSVTTFDRAIRTAPGFPAPLNIPGGPLLWDAGAVIEWQKHNPERRRAA